MAGKWEQTEQDGDRYNLQYRTQRDKKVRPEHAALDRVTLPMSDTFWQEYYPPNGWNCRCYVVPRMAAEVVGYDEKAAEESITLIRNRDVLPLDREKVRELQERAKFGGIGIPYLISRAVLSNETD